MFKLYIQDEKVVFEAVGDGKWTEPLKPNGNIDTQKTLGNLFSRCDGLHQVIVERSMGFVFTSDECELEFEV